MSTQEGPKALLGMSRKAQPELVPEEHERLRLKELDRYNVLDTPPEACFDEIAQLAAYICQTPIAVVDFVDANRVFLKARIGMEAVSEVPLVNKEQIFCIHAIRNDSLFVIPDALEDERFRCNPLVATEGVRFYAGAPLITPGGYRLGSLCVIDKVPRQLDAKQRLSLEQLARQVSAQLELRLTVRALHRQNQELERLNEEKSRFLSAVSHDVRQPLATVMMCSELMLNGEDDDQDHREQLALSETQVELASTVFTCAQFMHNLVDELLQMVEYDFGKAPVPLECRMTDLVSLVHRVVATNTLYARPKHITLRLSICENISSISPASSPSALTRSGGDAAVLPYDEWMMRSKVGARGSMNCNIDSIKIEQVLNNLISNAIKYSHPNSFVDIVVERSSAEGLQGKLASVSVIDHGQGIPREEMGKLFKPFQRLSVKPTGGETSTGLGLAIARNIVLAHSGDLQAESEQGLGSTFRMLLPLPKRSDLKNEAQPGRIRRPSVICRRSEGAEASAYNVLVVDDNAINLRLMKQILQRRGHMVSTASDGQEALELFHEIGGHKHFQVLLIDEEMPRMSGMELIKHIRQHEAQEHMSLHLPLVSVSGHADSRHKQDSQAAGADEICPKPFNADKLIEIVERLGSHYQQAQQVATTVAINRPLVIPS